MGSCILIATDKTGTLTVNELTVREVKLSTGETFTTTGEGFAPNGQVLCNESPIEPGSQPALDALARAGVLCNESALHLRNGSWEWRGDAVDVALLSFGHKLGWQREKALDIHAQFNQIPFESEYQYAATYHDVNGDVRVFVKGAIASK